MTQIAEKVVSFFTALVMTVGGFFFPELNGQIYIVGEDHANTITMAKELEMWGECYDKGMRDLFVEYSYYMAEYLNLWMDAPDDAILTEVFQDLEGTMAASPSVWDFFQTIKAEYPETVFHGTDIGHQYNTMGARYLSYLEQTGQKDTEAYQLTLENIEQGRSYYEDHGGSYAYREPLMAQNFQRAYDALPAGTSVMGIYGAYHTVPGGLDPEGVGPNMVSRLQEVYGERLHATDLTAFTEDASRVGETQTVTINGQTFTAVLLAAYTRPTGEGYTYWHVPGAYEAAKDLPLNGWFTPLYNIPGGAPVGEVYIIDTTGPDGATRRFYRNDGMFYYDVAGATGFLPEAAAQPAA